MSVSFQLRPQYVGNYAGGTISVGYLGASFNVGAALTAGGGTIVATSTELVDALSKYPPLFQSGSDSNPLRPSMDVRMKNISLGSGSTNAESAIEIQRDGDLFPRLVLYASGVILTGTGASAPTTQLRSDLDVSVNALTDRGLDPTDVGYDVFLIAGQSNAAGRGTGYDTSRADPVDPRIHVYGDPAGTFYPSQITPASEPLSAYAPEVPFLGATTPGMGFAIPFARWYLRTLSPNRLVLLVNTAWGGTAFEGAAAGQGGTRNWKVSTTGTDGLYLHAIAQTQAAIAAAGANARLIAVLWHQGEQDATNGTTAATYGTDLDALIDGLRTNLGDTNLLFILGQMTAEGRAGSAAERAIDAKQIETPSRKKRTAWVYGPGTGFTDPTNGTLHYNAAGLRTFGRSYFDALARAQANVLGADPPPMTAPTVSQSSTTVATVTWTQPVGRVTNFLVEYSVGAGFVTLTRTTSIDVNASITGLTAGTAIQVRVSAINEQGTSAASAPTSYTMLQTPGQVTGLATGTPTASTMPLTWTATPQASSYLMEFKKHADPTWTASDTVLTNSGTVTGLRSVTSYDFRVSATNIVGTGTVSATATTSTVAVDTTAILAESITRLRVSTLLAGSPVNGSAVASWGSLTQATGTAQPTIDTVNSEVVFDGTNDFMQDTGLSAPATSSLFVVGKTTALPSAKNQWLVTATVTTSPNGQQNLGARQTGSVFFASGGTDVTGATADTVQHVFGVVFDATNGVLSIDGTETTGSTGTSNGRSGLRLGANASTGTPTVFGAIRLKQVIVWARALTIDERAALATFLAANPT